MSARKSLLFTLTLLLTTTVSSAEKMKEWDYDHVASEPVDQWRYYAVETGNTPMPHVGRSRLAVVELPWQVERTRPMAYWFTKVTVPERFAGRDVFLHIETTGPTRVVVVPGQDVLDLLIHFRVGFHDPPPLAVKGRQHVMWYAIRDKHRDAMHGKQPLVE